MYWYNREGTSKCVLYREFLSFIWSVLYQNRIKIIFLQHFMHLAHMLGAARCSCASHLLAHQLMFMAIIFCAHN